jgi:formylglycine-generating enzyme required for sulfatase activity
MKFVIHIFLLGFVLLVFTRADYPEKGTNKYIGFDKNLYVSKFEVTNAEYNEFLSELKSSGNSYLFEEHLYDSTQWRAKFPTSFIPIASLYHTHSAYSNFPVVNIKASSAAAYCVWLTNKYNSQPHKKHKQVLFRLPTEAEWIRIVHSGVSDTTFSVVEPKASKFRRKAPYANLKKIDSTDNQVLYNLDGSLLTAKVGSYSSNDSGIFDLIGNVSELTSDGAIKGGNWDSFIEDCMPLKQQFYQLPDPRVGFRIVMEVIDN